MNKSAILLDVSDQVAIITLNRPECGNLLDISASAELVAVVRQLPALVREGAARAVLLRALGPHFCVGGNIQGFSAAGNDLPGMLEREIPPLHAALHTLATLPVPVVSAINGSVGGGGIGLALCADLVLGAHSMKLRGGYSAIGLTPDVGSAWFLSRLVGPMKTKQILFSNRPLDAQACLMAGLVVELHEDGLLDAAARALVAELARGATGAFAGIKALVDGATQRSLAEHLDAEWRGMVAAGGTTDAAEGVRAFLEKRAPLFQGR